MNATEIRLESHYRSLQADMKVKDPEGFIYFQRGNVIGMVFCQDRKPKDGHRLRRQIGIVNNRVFVTKRDEFNHFFRKYDGWCVSKFLVNSHCVFSFYEVLFLLPGGSGKIGVKAIIDRCRTICEGGYEPQYLVMPDMLDTAGTLY